MTTTPNKSKLAKMYDEIIDHADRARIDAIPNFQLYSEAEIKKAVKAVFERLTVEFQRKCGDRLGLFRRLLESYTFEWLPAQKDGTIAARSHEMLTSIGTFKLDKRAALQASIEAHLEGLRQMSDLGMQLPSPSKRVARKPRRTEVMTVRLTTDEMESIREVASIHSKNVSEVVRDTMAYLTSAPAEDDFVNESCAGH